MLVLVILLIGLIDVFVCAFWSVRFEVKVWMVHIVFNLVMNWVMNWVVWIVSFVVNHEVFLLFVFALTFVEVVLWVMRVLRSTVV